ncbi:unnamed protein product [Ixodes hexagonus]
MSFLARVVGVLLSLVSSKIVLLLVIALLCLKVYLVQTKGVCRSTQMLEGKTVIVTGGNSGVRVGKVADIIRRTNSISIVMNIDSSRRACLYVVYRGDRDGGPHCGSTGLLKVLPFKAEVSVTQAELEEAAEFAGSFSDTSEVQLTEDGYEVCFQSNYLGHFLLTILLCELLKKSAPSRVVNLTSILHHIGSTARLRDMAVGKQSWSHPVLVYSNTKMAMLVFSRALAFKLKPHGVTVNAVHPGPVKTTIVEGASLSVSLFFNFIFNFFGKTPVEGAQTSIYAAVEPGLANQTGKYLVDCRKDWISWNALGRARAQELFEASLKLVQLDAAQVEKQLEASTSSL